MADEVSTRRTVLIGACVRCVTVFVIGTERWVTVRLVTTGGWVLTCRRVIVLHGLPLCVVADDVQGVCVAD